MARNLGFFAGGVSEGFNRGARLGLDAAEARERGEDRARVRQAQDMEREQQITRQKLIVENTTDLVQGEDASGNIQPQRVPRKMSFEDTLNLYEKIGQHDMATGKMSAEQSLQYRQRLKQMEDEGVWDAYNTFRQTGNVEDAVRMFGKKGSIKLDPQAGIHESEKKDEITGMPYKAYMARTADGSVLTFDPLQTARLAGGAKGFLSQQQAFQEGRKQQTAERNADALSRRADAAETTAEAAMFRALNPNERGGANSGGVFGFKMDWLKKNMPTLTAQQQYSLATGQRQIPSAQIAKWAEDAVGRQEKLTGVPMKKDERDRKIRETVDFLRSFGESNPGLEPTNPGPNNPGAGARPKPGGRDYSNLW